MREFITPRYALREMPAGLPSDGVEREVAVLLSEHPQLAGVLAGQTGPRALASARLMLGIKPPRSRRAGYVGD